MEAEGSHLSGELARVKGRVDEMWKINCAQVVAFDETIAEKNAESERLTARVAELEAGLARTSEVDPTQSIHPPPSTRHIPVLVPARYGSAAKTAVPTGVPMTPTSRRHGPVAPPPPPQLADSQERTWSASWTIGSRHWRRLEHGMCGLPKRN